MKWSEKLLIVVAITGFWVAIIGLAVIRYHVYLLTHVNANFWTYLLSGGR